MDFNDIQSAWNDEKPKNIILPNHLEKLKSANTPLDKIKKNLKNEFSYQFISIFFLGMIPVFCKFSTLMTTFFYGLFVLFLVICAYFLMKMYWFYKRLNSVDTTTKDNLYDTYYELRLYMELCKSFTYSLVPFALIFVSMILLNDHTQDVIDFILHKKSASILIGALFAAFISVMVTVAFFTEWWINHFYGKYVKEIRKILDELKEE